LQVGPPSPKRARCRSRAATTRGLTTDDGSPRAGDESAANSTGGTSTTMSNLSISGPDSFAR